jgi:uncharacterized protein YkwD
MVLRRPALLAVLLAAWALAAPGAASADECPGADAVPAADNLAQVGQATLCLLNRQRAGRGLAVLAENGALSSASRGYAQRMVAQAFFAHESPDGGTLVDRLGAARYLAGDSDWSVGENIGWGQGALASARSMVDAWMRSPGHRRNILGADYREVGLGLALGTPVDASWGATYTTDFGFRGTAARKPARRCARSASAGRSRAGRAPRSRACTRSARKR